MQIVVTGGAGYIGSRLVGHLLEAGHSVRTLDRLVFGGDSLLSHFDSPKFSLIKGDIRDAQAVKQAFAGADAVVHLAALVGETACSVSTAATKSINQDAVPHLLAAAEAAGIKRFIAISTCSNYGIHVAAEFATEESPLNPLSLYSETKVAAEKAALAWSGSLIPMVLRFGTICGLSHRMRFDLLVNEMARSAVLGQKISVFSPETWRPFLHIKDACRAVEACLAAPAEKVRAKVYNVVSENCQKTDLVNLVRKHFPSVEISVEGGLGGKRDPRDYRVSAEKIKTTLDFVPRFTIEDAFLQIAGAVSGGLFENQFAENFRSVPTLQSITYEGVQI